MDSNIQELINRNTKIGNALDTGEFKNLISDLDISLPDDYVEFLAAFNGCEGSLTDTQYISLWSLDDLKKSNELYEVNEFAPELFLIGSDGGGMAFAFNRDDLSYVEVPFIGMSLEEAEYLGTNFSEFMNNLMQKSAH